MQLESSVTLFDDNKVENRFAELQITADGITSEVSKKVGNDEVISRINQSAEGIQIQANKVNIEGATIFSSGRLSQNSLNSAYDASGAATNAVSNLKSDLSSASGTTVINGGHIETGTLLSNSIKADSGEFNTALIPDLNASKITAGTITDSSGKNSWNLTSGQFVTKQGKIGDMDIDSWGLLYDSAGGALKFRMRAGYVQSRYLSQYGSDGIDIYPNTGISFLHSNDWPSDPWDGMAKAGYITSLYGGLTLEIPGTDGSWIHMTDKIAVHKDVEVYDNVHVYGTKNRVSKTEDYGERLLYCYETPTPLFGDIGEAVIDEDGLCYVDIDDIFSETIADKVEYQVFLQKEGRGDCWIAEKNSRYFVIEGTPNLKVAWELKAKQKDYEINRLEQYDIDLDDYVPINDQNLLLDDFITEQEELLYGNY